MWPHTDLFTWDLFQSWPRAPLAAQASLALAYPQTCSNLLNLGLTTQGTPTPALTGKRAVDLDWKAFLHVFHSKCSYFRLTNHLKEVETLSCRTEMISGLGKGCSFALIYGSCALTFWYGSKLIQAHLHYTPGIIMAVSWTKAILFCKFGKEHTLTLTDPSF